MKNIRTIIVVKVGTSTLVCTDAQQREQLDEASFLRIGSQLRRMQRDGVGVVLVSSGAITAGLVHTQTPSRTRAEFSMPQLQRLASIGWRHVLNRWSTALGDMTIGELLLTRRELGSSNERQEALHVIHALLAHGDIAIINENDAITHEEIAFGDNDTLAATLAVALRQSTLFTNDIRLVLLTDVDGVYAELGDHRSCIKDVYETTDLAHLAGKSRTAHGTGGMHTKFQAAAIATSAGMDMWIANGRKDNVLALTLRGETGTHFHARPTPVSTEAKPMHQPKAAL